MHDVSVQRVVQLDWRVGVERAGRWGSVRRFAALRSAQRPEVGCFYTASGLRPAVCGRVRRSQLARPAQSVDASGEQSNG
jgi:hypothetical protein